MCLDKPRCVWTSSLISPADLNCRVEGLKLCFQTKMDLKAYPYALCSMYGLCNIRYITYTVTYINHNNFDDLCQIYFSGHINLHQMGATGILDALVLILRWKSPGFRNVLSFSRPWNLFLDL